jgi:hypothetical protein
MWVIQGPIAVRRRERQAIRLGGGSHLHAALHAASSAQSLILAVA